MYPGRCLRYRSSVRGDSVDLFKNLNFEKLKDYIKAIGLSEFLKHAMKVPWFRQQLFQHLSNMGEAFKRNYEITHTKLVLNKSFRIELEMPEEHRGKFEERFYGFIEALQNEHGVMFKLFAEEYELKEISCYVTETGVVLEFTGGEKFVSNVWEFLESMKEKLEEGGVEIVREKSREEGKGE